MTSISPSSSSSYQTAMSIKQLDSIDDEGSHRPMQEPSSEEMISKLSINSTTTTTSTTSSSDICINDEKTDKYLGFSNNLVSYIQQSRKRLDSFIDEQMELSKQTNLALSNQVQAEKEEIRQLMKRVVEIQSSRGIISSSTKIGISKRFNSSPKNESMKENQHPNWQESANADSSDLINRKQKLKEKQEDVEKELANLHVECAQLQQKVAKSKEEEEIEYTKVLQVRKQKQLADESKRVSVEDLTYAVLKYKYLGLDFVKGDQCDLRCNFTRIDPDNDDRIFTFSLSISDDDQYEVHDCDPELSADVVIKLVEQLNFTGLLPHFFRNMRDAFINEI